MPDSTPPHLRRPSKKRSYLSWIRKRWIERTQRNRSTVSQMELIGDPRRIIPCRLTWCKRSFGGIPVFFCWMFFVVAFQERYSMRCFFLWKWGILQSYFGVVEGYDYPAHIIHILQSGPFGGFNIPYCRGWIVGCVRRFLGGGVFVGKLHVLNVVLNICESQLPSRDSARKSPASEIKSFNKELNLQPRNWMNRS